MAGSLNLESRNCPHPRNLEECDNLRSCTALGLQLAVQDLVQAGGGGVLPQFNLGRDNQKLFLRSHYFHRLSTMNGVFLYELG